VPLLLEESQKQLSNLVTGHDAFSPY
jgi:hypothetical protein